MTALAETPRHVVVKHPYGPCGFNVTDDKPFIHKRNGTYYLSWGCFYATGTSIYGPFETQGAVIDTALIAPDFRIGDGSEDVYNEVAGLPPPKRGDQLGLYPCPAGSASAAATWVIKQPAGDGWGAIHLQADTTLCITSAGDGEALTVESCVAAAKDQLFLVDSKGHAGADVHGNQSCECWNVRDDNARAPGHQILAGAVVQCYSCVEGSDFNPNQRFTVTSGGQIQAWKGYAPGHCVAVMLTPPKPAPNPPGTPWYKMEDYTDRHGSFLEHNGQWYYASNDRSHSGDVGHESAFRDTVVCYIHFRANNTMQPCVINGAGVGEYNAGAGAWIEAENYFNQNATETIDQLAHGGGSGFAVDALGPGASLKYPHVWGLPASAAATLTIVAANGNGQAVTVVATSASTGKALARCQVEPTPSWAVYGSTRCAWSLGGEGDDVGIVLSASARVRLDRFAISA